MKRIQILSTATALLFVASAAQAQRRQDDHQDRADHRGQPAPQAQPRPRDDNPGRGAAAAQQREVDQARAAQARAGEMENRQRNAQHDEQQRELDSRQREQMADVERTRQLNDRDRLVEAQRRAEIERAYIHDRDYRPVIEYRYRIGGVYRETNDFGVNILRQAVSLGYQRGYDAGLQDVRAGVSPNYQLAFDYQNGNYGFTPEYIPESDYSFYFRQGFQRGYDDAYWNSAQYGTFYDGTPSILGDVMAGILGLTTIQ